MWPDPWPTNDVSVARAMAFADDQGRLHEFALAAMRLAFREGGDLGDLSVVQAAGARAGIDPQRLADAIADQTVKDRVRANHDQAMALGVFGVPTVVLSDGRAFWGDDRLEEAAAAA